MNTQKTLNPKNLLVIFMLTMGSLTLKAQADGLEITLNEKEQALLNSLEQKNQAESLIKLLQTLEKLSEYPTEAIDELTGKNPNHQVINRVIKRLKQAKDMSNNSMVPLNFDSQKDPNNGSENNPLKPVFAVAASDNGITVGKVIFQNNSGTAINALVGKPFIYADKSYELISVTPVEGNKGQFNIRLKTPTSMQQYIWPR